MGFRQFKLCIPLLFSVALIVLLLGLLQGARPPASSARTLRDPVGGNITVDTTWHLADSPFTMTADVIVDPGVTLTIEPGVVVSASDDLELRVLGHLEALGTTSEPITFTSLEGSDRHQWSGLVFKGGTGNLDHVTVRFSGDRNSALGTSDVAAIVVQDVLTGEVRIENSHVISGGWSLFDDYGLYIDNSRVTVSGTAFIDTSEGNGSDNDYAVYATGSRTVVTLSNNTFNNTFGSDDYAVRVEVAHLHQGWMTDNVFDNNLGNRVLIAGGALTATADLNAQNGLEAYEFEGSLLVPAGMTLTVAPDVTAIMQRNVELQMQGHLAAIGSLAHPITFTTEDTVNGWDGLTFDGGTGALRAATVRYGGNKSDVTNVRSNIAVTNGGWLQVQGGAVLSEVVGTSLEGDFGIYAANSRVTVSGTLFRNNGEDEESDYVFYAAGGGVAVTITNSRFEDNWAYAAGMQADNLHRVWMWDNFFSGPGDQSRRVRVDPGTLVMDADLASQPTLEGYELGAGDDLYVPAGITLSVEAGVTVMGRDGHALNVQGHLAALGTPALPVTFTSRANDGPHQWAGLVFDGGTGWLRHATVRYGGDQSSVLPAGEGSNIGVKGVLDGEVRIEGGQVLSGNHASNGATDYGLYVENGHVVISGTVLRGNGNNVPDPDYALFVTGASSLITVAQSLIEGNEGDGLHIMGGRLALSCSTVQNNATDGVHVASGTISATVTGSVIDDDDATYYGLFVDTGTTVDARYNWWGDASGPSGNDTGGAGTVNTSPWLSAPACVVDLALDKGGWPDPVYVEEPLTYTLAVVNHSPSSASGVVVTDYLPAHVSFVSSPGSTCAGSGDVVTCTVDSVAGRAHANYVDTLVTVVVTPSVAAGGVITNVATVRSQTFDPWTANSTATLTTTVLPRAELAVDKSDTPDPVGVGDLLTYRLVITNSGPSTATLVVMTDDLPSEVDFKSAASAPGTICAAAGGVVTCERDVLAKGATFTATIVVTTPLPGLITNTATVTSAVFERDGTDSTVTATTNVGNADTALSKHYQAPTPLRVGGRVTYTLFITNQGGPNVATQVTLVDTLPVSATLDGSEVSQGSGCDEGSGVVTCDLGTLGIDATARVTLTVVTTGDGTLVNAANVSSFEVDPDPGDNADSVETPVAPVTDLLVAKRARPDPVGLEQPLTYTLFITNGGPSRATGVRLTDTLPATTSFGALIPGLGMSCGETNGAITCTVAVLAAGEAATATVLVTPMATGSVENRIWGSGNEFDPDVGNNEDGIITTVAPAVDLAVTKAATPDPVATGGHLTFTIAVLNRGPSTAPGVWLTDTLPVSVTDAVATSSQGSCDATGGAVACDLADLNVGATARVTVAVRVLAAGRLTNTVEVGSAAFEVEFADNVDEAYALAGSADLSVAKSATPDPALLGGALTYTLRVANDGPDDATGVRLTDTLPVGVDLAAVAPDQGSCSEASPDTIVCALGVLTAGTDVAVDVVVTPTAAGRITNTASVAGDQHEPDAGDNVSLVGSEVQASVEPQARLAVAKFGAPDPVAAGGTLTYTILITNSGPDTATGVRLTDTLPSSVDLVSALPTQGACSGQGVVICSLGSLAQDAFARVVIVVATTVQGEINNHVEVAGDQNDPDLNDNADSVTVTVQEGEAWVYLPLVLKDR